MGNRFLSINPFSEAGLQRQQPKQRSLDLPVPRPPAYSSEHGSGAPRPAKRCKRVLGLPRGLILVGHA